MIEATDGIRVPGITMVEKAELSSIKEILRLGGVVLESPNALHIRTPNYVESRVDHSAMDRVRLSVIRAYNGGFEELSYGGNIKSVGFGVLTPDIDMYLDLKRSVLKNYHLNNDPFAEMIMEYFASHEQSKSARITPLA